MIFYFPRLGILFTNTCLWITIWSISEEYRGCIIAKFLTHFRSLFSALRWSFSCLVIVNVDRWWTHSFIYLFSFGQPLAGVMFISSDSYS